MKKILLFLWAVMVANFSKAQSVGIGTSTPNSSAALDVASADKGFLLPLLSQTARLNIASPAEGLIVYDTTFQRFYQFQQSTWRYIINSDLWIQSSTSNNLYNVDDSVGIGTSAPQHRLDVNGNIHAIQNVDVAGTITATGSAQAATLVAEGNLVAGGTLVVMGNINADSGLVIDQTNATLQLKTSGTNKGFVARNGNDLHLGTNGGISTADIILRMNGDNVVHLSDEANLTLLKGWSGNKEHGKMLIGNRIIRKYSVTDNTNSLPIMYGRIFSDGFGAAMWPQSGSSVRISTGVYEINTNRTDMSDFGVIVVTNTGVVPRICIGKYIGNAKFRVEIFSLAGNHVNSDFYFMINDALN